MGCVIAMADKSFLSVLVPVDGSDHAILAARAAAKLVKKAGASATILHVLPYDWPHGEWGLTHDIPHETLHQLQEQIEKDGETVIGNAEDVFKEEGVPVKSQTVRSKHPADPILTMSKKDCEMIIMGAHGKDRKEPYALGNVTRNVVRHAGCPTLIVKDDVDFSDMLVCLDGSNYSVAALSFAVKVGEKMGSKFTLLNVQEERLHGLAPKECTDAGDKVFSTALKTIKKTDLTADKKIECGGVPADTILDVAEKDKHQLIVLGQKGITDMKRLLVGDVSDDVTYRAKCSVLVVP
jgi:nucleotide-binding universal stress UspA family protein